MVESARYAGFAPGPVLAAALAVARPAAGAAGQRGAASPRSPPRRERCAPAARRAGRRRRERALDGFRVLRSDRVLRATIGPAVGALLFISASLTVEIFYLKDVVGAGDTAYALLVGAWMVGHGRAGRSGSRTASRSG